MNLNDIAQPHRSEEVTLEVNDKSYDGISYYEWQELLTNLSEDADVSYSIWLQNESTNNELMVLNVSFRYENGSVTYYNEEVTE